MTGPDKGPILPYNRKSEKGFIRPNYIKAERSMAEVNLGLYYGRAKNILSGDGVHPTWSRGEPDSSASKLLHSKNSFGRCFPQCLFGETLSFEVKLISILPV